MLRRILYPLLWIIAAALLSACSLVPGTGPHSEVVEGNATAGLRSNAALPYALVDVSADTIGLLSQPNLVTFQGEFPDKRQAGAGRRCRRRAQHFNFRGRP